MAQPLEPAGFYWSGFLCLILAVLKLTLEAHWSWWRVLLPLWAVLGHNILYIIVGFVWLSFADGGITEGEVTIRSRAWWVPLPTGGAGVLCHFRG